MQGLSTLSPGPRTTAPLDADEASVYHETHAIKEALMNLVAAPITPFSAHAAEQRVHFEAWLTREHGGEPDQLLFQTEDNTYADASIQWAFRAWLASHAHHPLSTKTHQWAATFTAFLDAFDSPQARMRLPGRYVEAARDQVRAWDTLMRQSSLPVE